MKIMYTDSGTESCIGLMLTMGKSLTIYKIVIFLEPFRKLKSEGNQMRASPSKWRRNAHTSPWALEGAATIQVDRTQKINRINQSISQNFNKVLKARSELVYQYEIAAGPDAREHNTPLQTILSDPDWCS